MQRLLAGILFASTLFPGLLHAQENVVAITLGAAAPTNANGLVTCGEAINCGIPPGTIGPLNTGAGFSWQASFARRVANFRATALYVELPVLGSPSRSTPGLFNEYSSIFFTPSAQVKFLPRASISPFVSAGGGLAYFRNSTGSSSATTGALQLGGGVDFRTPVHLISVRTEVRDFITGRPGIPAFGGFTANHIQNLFVGGGVVFKF